MDGFGFTNWFEKSLLANLHTPSIIVMDNASYHSMSTMPKSRDRVGTMKDWLKENGIMFPSNATKPEIWAFVKKEKKNPKYYTIDRLATEKGHCVIRLPPYQCDLNPIELVMS
jgi:transposase